MNNIMNVPRTWKVRIKATGLSQERFARDINLSLQTIVNVMGGRVNPSLETFSKVEAYLQSLGQGNEVYEALVVERGE